MDTKTLVSIIIPVYNAEKTLYICMESLRGQTYKNLQVIFVNDSSKDNSLALINQFKGASTYQVEVISHEVNRGVAAARNTGLQAVEGDYIYFLDADDAIDPQTIELSLFKAMEDQLDIVGFSWYLTFEKNERAMNQPSFCNNIEAIENMMRGIMRWNLWLFLFKVSLFKDYNIQFIEGKNMGEDLVVAVKLFGQASRVGYLDRHFYHYGQSNSSSLTKTYSDSHIKQVTDNVNEVESYLESSGLSVKVGGLVNYLKLNIKLPLLISDNSSQYYKWLNWFPESNAYVMDNKSLPVRTRLLQFAAVKRQFWLIKLYNKLILRAVYGVFYK